MPTFLSRTTASTTSTRCSSEPVHPQSHHSSSHPPSLTTPTAAMTASLALATVSTTTEQCLSGPTMTTNGTSLFAVNGTQCASSVVTTTKKRHLGGAIAGGVVGTVVLLGLLYYLFRFKTGARSSNILFTSQLGKGSNTRELGLPKGGPDLVDETADPTEKGTKMAAGSVDDIPILKSQLPNQDKGNIFSTNHNHNHNALERTLEDTTVTATLKGDLPVEYSVFERPSEQHDPLREPGQIPEDRLFADTIADDGAPYAVHETLDNIERVSEDREHVAEITEEDELDIDYGTVIGIDLGTSYSRVGVLRGDKVEIIADDQDDIPSWVSFGNNERLVGDSAKSAFYSNPQNTIFNIKRLIGRRTGDQDLTKDMKYWPFKVEDQNGKPAIIINYKGEELCLTAEEITAMILRKLKEIAEVHLGHKVTHAVVTVPACFNDSQRQATKDAGTIAGLQVLRLINDPTATAIAYGLKKKNVKSQIIVYALGSGYFDVSLFSIENGEFKVLATAGSSRLGGEDFDNRVVDNLVVAYKKKTGVDITKNFLALGKLKLNVEKAKRTLSSRQEAQIEIPDFEGGKEFSETLTRTEFEDLNVDLFRETMESVEQILNDARVPKEAIDEVILVGGSTHIPKIQQLLKEYFDKIPDPTWGPTEIGISHSERSSKVKPLCFEVGNLLSETFPEIKDNIRHGYKKVTAAFTEWSRDNEPLKSINSAEAVVYGAAIRGATLSSSQRPANVVLRVRDVCTLSLGIKTVGGIFAKIIPRNTVIPIRKSEIFTTIDDYLTAVEISIFEGERPLVKDNNLLGHFTLSGIHIALRGVPKIKVTFAIDVSGILEVTAVDMNTRSCKSITITNEKRRLSQEDIDRMVSEAQRFAAEDETHRRRIEARNARRC